MAIINGHAVPIQAVTQENGLNDETEFENFSSFKVYWRNIINEIYNQRLEIRSLQVALKFFDKWQISEKELKNFIFKDLGVNPEFVTFINAFSLGVDGSYFVLIFYFR